MTTELSQAEQILQLVSDNPDALTAELAALDHVEPSPADKLRARIISGPDIRNIPPPVWMIPGVLRKRSVAMLYGPSAVGKSFVAVDLAGAILTGRDWQGFAHDTTGPVVYLAGEGASGVAMRMDAWSDHHSDDPKVGDPDTVLAQFHLLPDGVPMHDTNTWAAALVEVLTPLAPALIIVDTLHTHIAGASDSEDRPMGEFVATCTKLAQATGACVVFIHHTKKGELEYRGSTALFANSDTVLQLHGDTTTHGTVTTKKQKDGLNADPWTVGFTTHGVDPVTGGPLTLVAHQMSRPESTVDEATATDALMALEHIAGPGEPMSASTWAEAVQELYGWGMGAKGASTKFHNARRQLVEQGKVRAKGSGNSVRYHLPEPPEQLTM